MTKLLQYSCAIITGIVLFSCSTPIKYSKQTSSLSVDSTLPEKTDVKKLIEPYKNILDSEMQEVLVISDDEFQSRRDRPETKLGNLVADLSLETAQKMYPESIDFCLLNFGGLRTSLPKGEISRGKIFELMPFENELVVVTINKDSLKSLLYYLNNVGGQPISGNISFQFSGKETILKGDFFPNKYVRVLTSDYLAQGGDKMNFFLHPVKYESIGIKLRDAIIQYCIEQNKKGKRLTGKLDKRISFDETQITLPQKK